MWYFVISSPTMWLTALLGVSVLLWFCYWINSRDKQLINQIPGFKDWPIVGDILHLEQEPVRFQSQVMSLIKQCRAKNIPVLKLKVMGQTWIFLFSAKEVEKLLTCTTNINKAAEYSTMHLWLGLGLLTSSGSKWRSRRHMLTPSFHFSILKDFSILINSHARDLKDKLFRNACDTGKVYDIVEDITLSTLDIICDTAMGVSMDALNTDSEYAKCIDAIKHGLDQRTRTPFCEYDCVFNMTPSGRKVNKLIASTHEFTLKVIKERREAKEFDEQESRKHKPFLDLLLDCRDENGQPLTDSDIREEVDTFMFEGHDTTSSGIMFAVHLLGGNIEAQKKCQVEVDRVWEDCSKDLTTTDLSKMTYLECCIKEALRIFPPVPYFGRSLIQEMEIGGYQIPKAVSVYVAAVGLHSDPQVFPNPDVFDPDRFSPENSINRNPFAYVPFSAGQRNCIGKKFAMMELKIVLATLLKNFNIESTQSRDELAISGSLILAPNNGIKVKLTSRN